jgi:hypothetical protein
MPDLALDLLRGDTRSTPNGILLSLVEKNWRTLFPIDILLSNGSAYILILFTSILSEYGRTTASNVVSVIDESCSLGEDESGARSKIVSVFDQPWDIQTSKFNMFVSSIRHSVVKGTRDLRNSLFGGQSRVNKCVENKNAAYSDVELNQHQFSSKLQRHDSSSCNNNLSTIEQNAEGQLEKPVVSFPVLPYSDRIEVKSINVYAEPLDRRTSMGNRVLKLFSTKESKMPFGVDLVSPWSHVKFGCLNIPWLVKHTANL